VNPTLEFIAKRKIESDEIKREARLAQRKQNNVSETMTYRTISCDVLSFQSKSRSRGEKITVPRQKMLKKTGLWWLLRGVLPSCDDMEQVLVVDYDKERRFYVIRLFFVVKMSGTDCFFLLLPVIV
jgi:7,8-dihydro-6-hydroxymethylpterin-pyrophosphokinase